MCVCAAPGQTGDAGAPGEDDGGAPSSFCVHRGATRWRCVGGVCPLYLSLAASVGVRRRRRPLRKTEVRKRPTRHAHGARDFVFSISLVDVVFRRAAVRRAACVGGSVTVCPEPPAQVPARARRGRRRRRRPAAPPSAPTAARGRPGFWGVTVRAVLLSLGGSESAKTPRGSLPSTHSWSRVSHGNL